MEHLCIHISRTAWSQMGCWQPASFESCGDDDVVADLLMRRLSFGVRQRRVVAAGRRVEWLRRLIE
jgi:hypothetical protein